MSYIIIELVEYEPQYLDRNMLSEELGERILNSFCDFVDIEFPSPKTAWKWKLISFGWVGILRIKDDVILSLKPKIHTQNVFAMWEYAYRLKSFKIMDGIILCDTIESFYNQIAYLLAKRIMLRLLKGLYKSYEDFSERLSYVTGRIDLVDRLRYSLDVNTKCDFQENTANNKDNQILLWTLYTMLSGQELSQQTKSLVKKTYMALHGVVDISPCRFVDCIGRNYNSLNSDYQLLHSLCRFILEYTGPNGMVGNHTMMPFVVNMSSLYELFVAEWLKLNLPEQIGLIYQEKVSFGEDDKINYRIDLVMYDSINGEVLCIIDTKYKKPDKIQNDDINQMLAYMEVKNCSTGVLLYPISTNETKKYQINTKTIWQLGFNIADDIESAGRMFLDELLDKIYK